MTATIRQTLYAEALTYTDRAAFVSDLALSSLWGDEPEEDAPPARLALLEAVYNAAHTADINQLLRAHHLNQNAFARMFGIPLRTVQGWCIGERTPPDYVLRMAAELLSRDELL